MVITNMKNKGVYQKYTPKPKKEISVQELNCPPAVGHEVSARDARNPNNTHEFVHFSNKISVFTQKIQCD